MDSVPLLDHLKKQYNINDLQITATLETHGNRSVFCLESKQGRFVVKTLKEQLTIYSVLNMFQPGYFKFPEIISSATGEYTTKLHNDFIVLMEFVEGNEIVPPVLEFYRDYGRIVAELHRLPENNLPHREPLNSPVKKLQKSVADLKIPKKVKDNLLDFLRSVNFPATLTEGVIHGDLSYYNILKNKGQYFVADVDDVSRGQVVYDLGFILAFSFILTKSDFSKLHLESSSRLRFLEQEFSLFWQEYLQINPLPQNDLAAIIDCALLECIENIYSKDDNKLIQCNYERFRFLDQNKKAIDRIIYRY